MYDPQSVLEEDGTDSYHFQRHRAYLNQKRALMGTSVTIAGKKSTSSETLVWTVTEDIKREDLESTADIEFKQTGVFGFNFKHTPKTYGKQNKKAVA